MELTRGFLPANDPLTCLSDEFSQWESVAQELPKLMVSNQLRATIGALEPFPVELLNDEQEWQRAMVLLSYLGHAYVWTGEVVDRIPAVLAKPWYQVAMHLGRHPVLSYASYSLHNWYRLDPNGPIAVGNIALVQNFMAGVDEEWFILIHVDIEAKATLALQAIDSVMAAATDNDVASLIDQLEIIRAALEQMCDVLDKMPEHCDPFIYYNRVRPYIHGWKNNPVLPNGLVYEGVDQYGGEPQQFRGETGAQSGIIPCMDGLFGIEHSDDPLKEYLMEMRWYMPRAHREFLQHVEQTSTLREFVIDASDPKLTNKYNQCVELMARFRTIHLGFASAYIDKQSETSAANPTQTGTGGTPFMQYLSKHVEETKGHLVGNV